MSRSCPKGDEPCIRGCKPWECRDGWPDEPPLKPDIAALQKRLAEDPGFAAQVTGDRLPTPGCHTPEGCRENGCLGWCDEHKPPTRSQKMREAGYTRRPSAKSLPSDE